MVMPKGEACGSTDILDGERDRNANEEQDERGSQAVKETGMHQGTSNKDRGQSLRKWRRVPRKADASYNNTSYRQPEGDFSR
jgi:hypothetical protein